VIVREDSTPSILDIVTMQSAAFWPANFPLRRSIVARGITTRLMRVRRGPIYPYQVLERNRQRPIACEFAEQIAVQVIHARQRGQRS
jgi:hypothetical protein